MEAVWLRDLLQELLEGYREVSELKTTAIFEDNQGAIAMSKNFRSHTSPRHIDSQHHYCRQKINDGTVEFRHVPAVNQAADGLAKALPKERFHLFKGAITKGFRYSMSQIKRPSMDGRETHGSRTAPGREEGVKLRYRRSSMQIEEKPRSRGCAERERRAERDERMRPVMEREPEILRRIAGLQYRSGFW
ncbi:Gag-Pol poly [Fusarium albosuccineum]|uniref:Gag-Pol poly n=1 Tax=Fusarium albosuccineum TaxID=1237068 RepID=A0A8H4LNB6_9HYPO|nr:Gag-Pol poly [Fusarium albosuccineum]